MEKHIFNEIHLWVLKVLGLTTASEEQELQKQVSCNEKLQQLLHDIDDPAFYNERQQLLRQIDPEKELADFLARHARPAFSIRRLYRWAAVIVLLLGSGVAGYLSTVRYESPKYAHQAVPLYPVGEGATLILSDGTIQNLGAQPVSITETDGSRILQDSARLNYSLATTDTTRPVIYNQLATGRGFEYMLILQDGTKVWMNAESRLEYPVKFTGTVRHVKLSGEAYFEVVHDTTRPFVVEVNQQFKVEVLGTSFNIKAYPGDEHAATTLVKGKVAINKRVLAPSEQARVYKDKPMEIQRVNVDYYLAWHEGWFYFNNERLEQVLEQIARWYDVTFTFNYEAARYLPITGKVKRFENLQVILDMLSTTTKCQFEINEKNVCVTK